MAIVCELLQDSVANIVRKHPDISVLRRQLFQYFPYSISTLLSLFRIQFARDTAAGMAWLHGAVIIFV
jgi:hypothetical protein